MTTTTETDSPTAAEPADPPLGELLLQAAEHPRDKDAVRALVEEKTILSRHYVRMALFVTNDQGAPVGCAWESLASWRYGLGLDEGQRAFLDLILSIAGPHQVYLSSIMELDDRRLAIVLRAMTEMAGNDVIVIATRI